jgi:hypothetical protein
VVFILVLQISAIDHWHNERAEVLGLKGSQAHVQHCHGGASSCADSISFAGVMDLPAAVPLPPPPAAREVIDLQSEPAGVRVAVPSHPPRYSA